MRSILESLRDKVENGSITIREAQLHYIKPVGQTSST